MPHKKPVSVVPVETPVKPASKESAVAALSAQLVAPVEPLLVSLSEAARLLGVKMYTIRKMCRRGVLPYRTPAVKWMIPRSAIKNFVEGRKAA